jgi:EF-P beta-lysylation protein EpmB
VLLIVSGACAINCRYCFRREFPYSNHVLGKRDLAAALEYIQQNPSINEVILSGGDPLIANDAYLADLAEQISKIEHITTLRIHTRIPIVMPTRINAELLEWLAKVRAGTDKVTAKPMKIVIVVHTNHPNEIDAEVAKAIAALTQQQIVVLNQAVLLKGVNDDPLVLQQLSEKLFQIGIMPYYLHLLDKVKGSKHFAVPLKRAKQIYSQLQALLPGYLVPKLVREIAGKDSKTIVV